MTERPLILFPTPDRASEEKRKGFPGPKLIHPSPQRQFDRLQPAFNELREAFENKRILLQDVPIGMDPEYALVFEVVGSVESFYTAVMKTDGLEWLFDSDSFSMEPTEDFYYEEKDQKLVNGKIYCLMSNQQALRELIRCWKEFRNGKDVFQRGYKGLRDILTQIVNIRAWNADDRISETNVIEYWKESIAIDGDKPVPFEVELFFRKDTEKRTIAEKLVADQVKKFGGKVLQSCVIEEIAYHAMLVEMPRNQVSRLVTNYNDVELVRIDDIMYFRPICQAAFQGMGDTEEWTGETGNSEIIERDPIVGILDGMPVQNHQLLKGRVIIDDPDGYENNYEARYRMHGTGMASLILNGDLNHEERMAHRIYMRPIMRPKVFPNGEFVEEIPPDCLIVDKIHSAVVRIMGTKDDYEGVAPTVKVINLSIGDEARQLATEMSPLARLLDYLAYKYKVLFIVSAGNHRNAIDMLETDFEELRSKNIDGRSQDIYGMIKKQQRRMKMLSPGEQMNGLTIGALYDDYCDNSENSRMIYAVDRGLPSPISAFGRGYHSMIVPDLFYMGGRKFIGEKSINGTCRWVNTLKAPGCRTAAPFVDGAERGQAYSFGTSDATALITHEALKCYDVLCEIFMNETGEMPSGDLVAVLIKAMLTHGASWDGLYDRMSALIGGNRQNMEQWLGNGVPNVAKVESCAENRITLIGTGRLKNKEGDIFHLPLPVNISSKVIRRRLVVTLAYLSPIAAQRQSYRGVRMWFVVEGAEKLAKDRENTDFRRVQKGTLQHEIFVSDKAEVWDEENEVQIKVSCKRDVSKISEAIPYALFVTFEVAEGQDIDVYTKVAEKVKQMVKTT